MCIQCLRIHTYNQTPLTLPAIAQAPSCCPQKKILFLQLMIASSVFLHSLSTKWTTSDICSLLNKCATLSVVSLSVSCAICSHHRSLSTHFVWTLSDMYSFCRLYWSVLPKCDIQHQPWIAAMFENFPCYFHPLQCALNHRNVLAMGYFVVHKKILFLQLMIASSVFLHSFRVFSVKLLLNWFCFSFNHAFKVKSIFHGMSVSFSSQFTIFAKVLL